MNNLFCVVIFLFLSINPALGFFGHKCSNDYVVVGAGVAGSVFARRAAEAGYSVTVLERGNAGPAVGPLATLFANSTPPFFNSLENRIPRMGVAVAGAIEGVFPTAPQPGALGTPSFVIQASVLGGGSKINGHLFLKPEASEFTLANGWPENWNATFIEEAFDQVEQVLQLEKNTVELPILGEFFDAASQPPYNLPTPVDINNFTNDRTGVSLSPLPRRNGQRLDAYTAYLSQPQPGWRLSEVSNMRVDYINIRKRFGKVKNVVATNLVTGEETTYCASKGVVLAAGAINTPLILEKSGIGNPLYTDQFNRDVQYENNEIGENLQDHLGVQSLFVVKKNDDDITDLDFLQQQYNQYLSTQDGLFADTGVNGVYFDKVGGSTVTNFQSSFLIGGNTRYPDLDKFGIGNTSRVLFVTHSCNEVKSRGSVHTGTLFPDVNPNYGGDITDINCLSAGIKKFTEILNSTGSLIGELKFDFTLLSDATTQLLNVTESLDPSRFTEAGIRQRLVDVSSAFSTFGVYHYGGSVALGKAVDPDTMLVDATKVGSPFCGDKLRNLYVVDASLFPKVPRANTMATTYAVAERASSIILDNEDCFGPFCF